MTEPVRELIYVADTMCSWCWGFVPVLDLLQERTGLPVRIVNGGLRPGAAAEPMTDAVAAFIGEHWDHVQEASGQPFDRRGLLRRGGWRYDTEPAAMAVVTMRKLAPEHERAFFVRLQRAFYAENVDITDPEAWRGLLAEFPVDAEEFLALATSDDARMAAWRDFSTARSWGITGFPTLLVREDDEASIVTRGWAPPEAVLGAVEGRPAERRAAEAEGEACAIDGDDC